MPVIPFFHPGMMRVIRSTKSDVQSVECFYLNNGRTHSTSTVKLLKASMEGVCYTNDIVWMTTADVADAGRREGLSGLRRRADNVAGILHHIRATLTAVAVTAVAVTAVAITAGSRHRRRSHRRSRRNRRISMPLYSGRTRSHSEFLAVPGRRRFGFQTRVAVIALDSYPRWTRRRSCRW